MHNWRPYIWRTFAKDWSIHWWWWWFSKLCRLTSQKPLLLWPIYWKCKAGPPGHLSQSWQTRAGREQAGFGFPAAGKQFQERVWITLEQAAMSHCEASPEYYSILLWISVPRQALSNRSKAHSCFSKVIKEQVWHSEALYHRTCSRQRTVWAMLR